MNGSDQLPVEGQRMWWNLEPVTRRWCLVATFFLHTLGSGPFIAEAQEVASQSDESRSEAEVHIFLDGSDSFKGDAEGTLDRLCQIAGPAAGEYCRYVGSSTTAGDGGEAIRFKPQDFHWYCFGSVVTPIQDVRECRGSEVESDFLNLTKELKKLNESKSRSIVFVLSDFRHYSSRVTQDEVFTELKVTALRPNATSTSNRNWLVSIRSARNQEGIQATAQEEIRRLISQRFSQSIDYPLNMRPEEGRRLFLEGFFDERFFCEANQQEVKLTLDQGLPLFDPLLASLDGAVLKQEGCKYRRPNKRLAWALDGNGASCGPGKQRYKFEFPLGKAGSPPVLGVHSSCQGASNIAYEIKLTDSLRASNFFLLVDSAVIVGSLRARHPRATEHSRYAAGVSINEVQFALILDELTEEPVTLPQKRAFAFPSKDVDYRVVGTVPFEFRHRLRDSERIRILIDGLRTGVAGDGEVGAETWDPCLVQVESLPHLIANRMFWFIILPNIFLTAALFLKYLHLPKLDRQSLVDQMSLVPTLLAVLLPILVGLIPQDNKGAVQCGGDSRLLMLLDPFTTFNNGLLFLAFVVGPSSAFAVSRLLETFLDFMDGMFRGYRRPRGFRRRWFGSRPFGGLCFFLTLNLALTGWFLGSVYSARCVDLYRQPGDGVTIVSVADAASGNICRVEEIRKYSLGALFGSLANRAPTELVFHELSTELMEWPRKLLKEDDSSQAPKEK